MKTNIGNSAILSIVVLGILIIPIISLDYVENKQKEEILNLGSYNYNVNEISITNLNNTEFNEHYNIIISEIIWSNNPTMVNFENLGLGNINTIYTDNITYIGNNTYSIDSSDLLYWDLMIPLNLTSHNLTKLDFLIIYSNTQPYIFVYEKLDDDANAILPITLIKENTYLVTIPLPLKIDILTNYDDEKIYLLLFDFQPNMEFSIYSGINEENKSFIISDLTQYYIILTGSIAMSLFTLIFITQTIDIIFDYKDKKKNKWKK